MSRCLICKMTFKEDVGEHKLLEHLEICRAAYLEKQKPKPSLVVVMTDAEYKQLEMVQKEKQGRLCGEGVSGSYCTKVNPWINWYPGCND